MCLFAERLFVGLRADQTTPTIVINIRARRCALLSQHEAHGLFHSGVALRLPWLEALLVICVSALAGCTDAAPLATSVRSRSMKLLIMACLLFAAAVLGEVGGAGERAAP